MPAAIRHYVRIIDRLSDYVGYVAMMLIFLMVGILLLDAVTRNVVHIPLHWCIEFAQFTLAAYYFMGGAMTHQGQFACAHGPVLRAAFGARQGQDGSGDDRLHDLLPRGAC